VGTEKALFKNKKKGKKVKEWVPTNQSGRKDISNKDDKRSA